MIISRRSLILGMILEFSANHGKRLDQSRDILMGPDASRVEDERVVDLKSLPQPSSELSGLGGLCFRKFGSGAL